jgi:hypothetical protein
MNSRFTSIATAAALVLVGTLTASAVSADPIVLAYQGKTYTGVYHDPLMRAEYLTSMRVTGFLELSDPLPADCVCTVWYYGTDPRLGDFGFFDGLVVHDGFWQASFTFKTDPAGQIVAWDVRLLGQGFNAPFGRSETFLHLSSGTGDYGEESCFFEECDPRIKNAFSAPPGRWAVVPEPASFTLLLVGLAGFGAFKRRRTRVSVGPHGEPSRCGRMRPDKGR